MGKKSRLKKEKRANRTSPNSPLVLREFHHPLAGMPQAELAKLMGEVGRDQAAKFHRSIGLIQELIRQSDPLGTLATMAYYGLLVGLQDDGRQSEAPVNLLPAHVELMQAFCLQIPAELVARRPVDPRTMERVFDQVRELSDQFHSKRFVQVERALTESQAARLAVLESIRLSTQSVRNWGYYDKVLTIASDLMQPINTRFEAFHGFSSRDLTLIFDHIFRTWTERMNAHRGALVEMVRAETLRETIDAYYSAFPDLAASQEECFLHFRKIGANLKTVNRRPTLTSNRRPRLTRVQGVICAS